MSNDAPSASDVLPDFARFASALPAFPSVPREHRGEGRLQLRYEDVAQDGRLAARTISHAIGAAIWRDVLERTPWMVTMLSEGMLPVLSRLVMVAGGGPIVPRDGMLARGGYELVRTSDPRGRTRFRLDMFATAEGTASTLFTAAPKNAGEAITLGAVWGEHVLTRPFAPPSERAVESLPEGLTASRTVPASQPDDTLALPEGARWLDDWQDDVAPIVFGLGHTDSNQHVNSLVYPTLLEEAALRRAGTLGRDDAQFVTRFEFVYRKPSFAGDRLALRLRAFERSDGTVGAVALFGRPDELDDASAARARVFARIDLGR